MDDETQQYFERVEQHFIERRGRPLLLSPQDVQRVAQWHRDGIALSAVVEGIDVHFDRMKRRGRAPRRAVTLAYCEDDVLDAWAGAKRRRVGRGKPSSGDGDEEPQSLAGPEELAHLLEALTAAREAAAGRGLPGGVAEALGKAASKLEKKAELFDPSRDDHDEQRVEDHLRRLEKSLQKDVRAALGEPHVERLAEEARAELGEKQARLSESQRERVLEQLVARRIRDLCGVPRLSLFYA